jgi:V/A-type H+-transporting ATPase subunit E
MENLKAQLGFLKEIEVKEIIEEANSQAAKQVTEAKEKARLIKTKETEGILQKMREMEIQELDSVKLRGKQTAMNLRFQLIETAVAESFRELKKLVEQEDATYRKSLERFVAAAVIQTEGAEFEVILNPRDVAHVKQKLKRIEKEVSTAKKVPVALRISDEPLQSVGGVVVKSKDGKQIFNDTLEARFAKVKQEALFKISEILFEGAKE